MEIICLANSYKHHGRCIAGIDRQSGQWVRPVSNLDDGRIPLENQQIQAEQISILDIIEISLDHYKPGYEIENVGYLDQPWRVKGRAHVAELLRYCDSELLYADQGRAIPYMYLKEQVPLRTLQLIEVKSLSCQRNDRGKWRAMIRDEQYHLSYFELSITDPLALEKLNQGQSLSSHCLLCMSLGQPWRPTPVDELFCYRLVAGVIELLPEIDLILTEMQRIGWTIDQGRHYAQITFGKKSRYQLTQAEAQQFLDHLRHLH